MIEKKEVPIFILCGGLGTRIKEETEFRPKPMVPIGDRPILWHIMKAYSKYGFKKFILCTGFKSEVIKDFFLNYSALNSDFTLDFKSDRKVIHSIDHDLDWEVTVAYTGALTMTGARIFRAAKKYLGNYEHFGVTYGDGLTDANLRNEFEFHVSHKKTGTVLGVNPPSRFGEIKLNGDAVVEFAEKPEFNEKWINGGYFFFRRDFVKYLNGQDNCILEKDPLVNLAENNELNLYKHSSFWACMDTQRDRDHLNHLWDTNSAPWL